MWSTCRLVAVESLENLPESVLLVFIRILRPTIILSGDYWFRMVTPSFGATLLREPSQRWMSRHSAMTACGSIMWPRMRALVRFNESIIRHVLVQRSRETLLKACVLPRHPKRSPNSGGCIWIRPGQRGNASAVKTSALTGHKRKVIFHFFAQSRLTSRWTGRLLQRLSTSLLSESQLGQRSVGPTWPEH